jgi:ABC-2 type transport system permease protein
VSSLVQPLLLLFVLGKGLASTVGSRPGGGDYTTFVFPGVVATGVMFTAAFSCRRVIGGVDAVGLIGQPPRLWSR